MKKYFSIALLLVILFMIFNKQNKVSATEGFLGTTGSRYYYSQLNETQKRVYDSLYRQTLDFCNSVAFTSQDLVQSSCWQMGYSETIEGYLDTNELFNAIMSFESDNPQFFFVNPEYSSDSISKTSTVKLNLKYYYFKATRRVSAVNMINTTMSDWQQQIQKESNAYNKLIKIHDLIIQQAEYCSAAASEYDERTQYYTHCLAGLFTDKNIVCEGYAKTFQYIAMLNGIDVICVEGTAGSQMEDHMWNEVKVDEKWYGCDVTWDDRGNTAIPEVQYLYFCAPLDLFNKQHTLKMQDNWAEPDLISTDTDAYYYVRSKCMYNAKDSIESFIKNALATVNSEYIHFLFNNVDEANNFIRQCTGLKRITATTGILADSVVLIYTKSSLVNYLDVHASTTPIPTISPAVTPSPMPETPIPTPPLKPTPTLKPMPTVEPIPQINPYLMEAIETECDYTIWSYGTSDTKSVIIQTNKKPSEYVNAKGKTVKGKFVWRISPTKITPVIDTVHHKVITKNNANAVATINSKGKVTAKSKKNGTVYVYACDVRTGYFEEFIVSVRQAPYKIVLGINNGYEVTKKSNKLTILNAELKKTYTVYAIPYISKKDKVDSKCTYKVRLAHPEDAEYVSFSQIYQGTDGYYTFTITGLKASSSIIRLEIYCEQSPKKITYLSIKCK